MRRPLLLPVLLLPALVTTGTARAADVPVAPEVRVAVAAAAVHLYWGTVGSADPLTGWLVTARDAAGRTASARYEPGVSEATLSASPSSAVTFTVRATTAGATGAPGTVTTAVPRTEVVLGDERTGLPGRLPVADRPYTRPVDGQSLAAEVLAGSPDGRRELVTSTDPYRGGLFTLTYDGSPERRVGDAADEADVSPDSTRALVLRHAFVGIQPVVSVAVVGLVRPGEVPVPVPPTTTDVAWLDDRTALLTVQPPGGVGRSLLALDLASGATRPVPGSAGAFGPAVRSPDGATIAFTRLDHVSGAYADATSVQLLPARGGTPVALPGGLPVASAAAWRADGKALLVWSYGLLPDQPGAGSMLDEVPLAGGARTLWLERTSGMRGPVHYRSLLVPTTIPDPPPRVSTVATVELPYVPSPHAAGYEARVRRIRWDGVASAPVATRAWPLRVAAVDGQDTCLDVRSRDDAGRRSAWVTGCTVRPLDDRALTASRGWARKSSRTAHLGTATTSRTPGATLTLGRAVMTRGWLLADRCPGCGSVAVTVGGRLLGTVSLGASRLQVQQLVPLPGAGPLRSGAVVLRTTSARPVTVDGLAVVR